MMDKLTGHMDEKGGPEKGALRDQFHYQVHALCPTFEKLFTGVKFQHSRLSRSFTARGVTSRDPPKGIRLISKDVRKRIFFREFIDTNSFTRILRIFCE